MNYRKYFLSTLIFCGVLFTNNAKAQVSSLPNDKKWEKVETPSDEINKVVAEESKILDDKVAFKNVVTRIFPANSYSFNMKYSASTDREIIVSFWKNNSWIASKIERVSKGSGVKSVTINLSSRPDVGSGYIFKSHIRPIGTNWQEALDTDQVNNIKVISTNPGPVANKTYANTSTERKKENILGVYPNPMKDFLVVSGASVGDNIIIYDLPGTIMKSYVAKSDKEVIDASTLNSGVYIISIEGKLKLQLIKE